MNLSRMKGTSYDVTTAGAVNHTTETNTQEPAQLVWFGQAVSLKDFPEQYQVPNIVKIVQGEYMNLGPKEANNKDNQENELLIYSLETTTKVLGVNLRVKDGRGVSQTENKLSIPLSYDGWFEVLSEDGRRVKPIETIKDLARIFPHTCLVRKAIDAFVPLPDGSVRSDSTRTVAVGETLTLFGMMQMTVTQADTAQQEPIKFLRCLDAYHNSVYFQHDQIGLFSPVAGKENISGVHTLKGILNKFHLPVTCKLVHGSYPKNVDKTKFSGIMRIVYVYDEQTAFVCPASGQYRMIPIPAEVPMKVVPAVNFDEIRTTPIISKVLQRCSSMVKCFNNSIHLLYDVDVLPPPKPNAKTPVVESSTDTVNDKDKEEKDDLYDEIEDIYFYVVRHGVAPPAVPKRLYKEGEQDNDFWDQPIYKTLHRQRNRKSIVDLSAEANGNHTKMFRFYHDGVADSRPLAYIKTDRDQVDSAVEIRTNPAKPPKLVANRRLSDAGIDKKSDKKERRKSQPAIFRFFFKSKEDKSDDKGKGGGSSDGSTGKGSSGNQLPPRQAKEKMKNLYL